MFLSQITARKCYFVLTWFAVCLNVDKSAYRIVGPTFYDFNYAACFSKIELMLMLRAPKNRLTILLI